MKNTSALCAGLLGKAKSITGKQNCRTIFNIVIKQTELEMKLQNESKAPANGCDDMLVDGEHISISTQTGCNNDQVIVKPVH